MRVKFTQHGMFHIVIWNCIHLTRKPPFVFQQIPFCAGLFRSSNAKCVLDGASVLLYFTLEIGDIKILLEQRSGVISAFFFFALKFQFSTQRLNSRVVHMVNLIRFLNGVSNLLQVFVSKFHVKNERYPDRCGPPLIY